MMIGSKFELNLIQPFEIFRFLTFLILFSYREYQIFWRFSNWTCYIQNLKKNEHFSIDREHLTFSSIVSISLDTISLNF